MIGSGVLFAGSWLGLALGALAIVATSLGRRFAEPVLTLQGAVLLVGAAIASGLAASSATLWLSGLRTWPSLPVAAWLTVTFAALAFTTPRPASWEKTAVLARL